MSDPVTRKGFSNQIEKQREDLNKLQSKKDKISAYSAEALVLCYFGLLLTSLQFDA